MPLILSLEQTSVGFDAALNPARINDKEGNKQGNESIVLITQAPITAYTTQETQSISYSTSQNSSSQFNGKGNAGMAPI